VRRLIEAAREAQRHCRRTFGFQAKVGQHVLHQRLIQQPLPESMAEGGVMQGLSQGARMLAAEPKAQSRRVCRTISMIAGTPRPSSPTIRARAP